jgi:hypothetical protein
MTRLAVAWTILSLASTPDGVLAQAIAGRVLEVGSERPVSAASIALVADNRLLVSTVSDSAGVFQVAAPRAGWYSLRVERLGYVSATSDSLQVGARESVEVAIRLSVTAIRLEPLLVVERRREVRPQSEFERRVEGGRRSGLGVFITRADLDSTSAQSVTALLARVPLLSGDGLVSMSQGGCTPTLYLNGARFQIDSGLDDLVQPGTLEGIEIYRNPTELPRNLAGIGHCAAIVFWTRSGDSRRGASWRFLAAGGALLGMLVVVLMN